MTVTGTESYAVSYTYDANNRLLTEQKTQGLLTDLTTYIYDANGNLLSKTVLAGNGGAAGSTYAYNTLNQLVSATENQRTAAYAYNAQGIRTAKVTFSTRTNYLLDGANVVGERLNGEYVSYLRGANLISRTDEDGTDYYLFNAHGDLAGLADSTGTNTRTYDYDAFGVEKDPDPLDENPFRYCGEYFDRETETYYLRARYYDPTIGRFTQQDTHWTTANSIYGDNPQKINEREDKLGLKTYSYAPQITAVMQSGNLYVYCISNPIIFLDSSGQATQKGTPPPESSGFVPPKGKKPEESWNKQKGGWEDKNGNIWVPDKAGHGFNRETGESDHWDVQNPDGTGYINVGPDGHQWGGKGKRPKLPVPQKAAPIVQTPDVSGIVVAVVIVVLVKWSIAAALAPATGGTSLVVAAIA